MRTRLTSDPVPASSRRGRLGRPLGALLLLLLGWGSAAPARATIYVGGFNPASVGPSYTVSAATNSSVTDNIEVDSGGELDIEDGGSVTPGGIAVQVYGGTVNISGGSIGGAGTPVGTAVYLHFGAVNISGDAVLSGVINGLAVDGGTATISGTPLLHGSNNAGVSTGGGTVTISGGSISGFFGVNSATTNSNVTIAGGTITGQTDGVDNAGTMSISSGSIAGQSNGLVNYNTVSITGGSITTDVFNYQGTATISGGSITGLLINNTMMSIYGCCLQLAGSQLTGTLQDGTPIAVSTRGITASNFINTCSGGLSVTVSANPSVPSGSNLTYTITVQYAGLTPAAAQNITLTDPLPAGTSFVSASTNTGSVTPPTRKNSTVSWNVGSLGNGGSATLTVVAKVSAKAGVTLTNTATASSGCPPAQVSGFATTTVAARR